MKRRRGETEKGRNREKKKLTDSPIPRFSDSKKAGFTILEAMIALIILSMALLALLRVMPVGIKGSKLAEDTTIATMLAQRKIEEMRADTWSGLGDSTGDFSSEGYPNFDYAVDVTTSGNLTEVTVSIYWPHGATDHCVGIKTYIADHT